VNDGDSKTPPKGLYVTPPPSPVKRNTSVTSSDINDLHSSIQKIASAVNKSATHTARIPKIERKVDSTSDKVIELDTKLAVASERVNKIEGKVDQGHQCVQIDVISELRDGHRSALRRIETGAHKAIEGAVRLDSVVKSAASTEEDVEEIKKAPKKMFYSLIGVLVTVAFGLGGGIWFLAELSKDVEFERVQRMEQMQRIEVQVKALGRKTDPAPIKQELQELGRAVTNSHDEYNKLCVGLSSGEKRALGSLFRRRGKKIPASCLR